MPAPGLYPKGAPRPTTSHAEQALHRALGKQLPEGWVAWHSLRVRVGARLQGEGDFVLAVPSLGVVVLEVKGGAIEVRGGRWYQGGREMDEAPRDQAHRYAGKLRSKLEDAGVKCPWIAIATAFPETHFSNEPSEGAVRGAVLGQQDLSYLDEALPALVERLFDGARPPPRDRRWIDALHALWCETWTPALALGDRTRLRERELVALDEQQIELLDSLDRNERLLITGGPGTGKTLVARELCRRLTERGRRPLYLCSTLALAAGLRSWGLSDAWTVRDFAAQLLERAGVAMQDGAHRSSWSAETWDLAPLHAAADALPLVELPYDALVLDEGQDLAAGDWDFVAALAGDGLLWAFADAGQGFWTDRGVPDGALGFRFDLTKRYRCPEPLAAFADRYRPEAVQGDGVGALDEPIDELHVVRLPSASALGGKVAGEIDKALSAGAARSDIAVLTLSGQTRTSLGVADAIGKHKVVRADAPDAGEQVICDTFLRFKGLERPWIIVTELAAAGDHRYDVRMHIALTRATVGCVVVALGEQVERDGRLGAAAVR